MERGKEGKRERGKRERGKEGKGGEGGGEREREREQVRKRLYQEITMSKRGPGARSDDRREKGRPMTHERKEGPLRHAQNPDRALIDAAKRKVKDYPRLPARWKSFLALDRVYLRPLAW